MRLHLLLAVALLLASCGGVQRTALTAPPATTYTDRYGREHVVEPRVVAAPVYAHPRATVLAACIVACDTYCHDVPEVVDHEAGTLRVFDRNAWTGSLPLSITLVDLGDGCTRMDMETGESPDFLGDESDLQRKRMRGFAEAVARQLRTVDLMQAAQPAVTGSGAGTVSATSRP